MTAVTPFELAVLEYFAVPVDQVEPGSLRITLESGIVRWHHQAGDRLVERTTIVEPEVLVHLQERDDTRDDVT